MFLQVACSMQVLRFVRYKPFCVFLALFIVYNITQFWKIVKQKSSNKLLPAPKKKG
jgi:hypothetical protein